jgi:ferredoxin
MTIAVMACADGWSRDADWTALRIVDELCRHPEVITDLEEEVTGLVLFLHGEEMALAEVQASIRAAGLDPLGVPILEIAEFADDPQRLGIAAAGAAARAAAFRGSEPAHAKPVFPTRLTRRSLFTIPKPAYTSAPTINTTVCAAGDGCKMCVGVCPQDAYRWVEGRIVYDKDACEPCGRCVTACPTGAITNPAAMPVALAAQIEAITIAAAGPAGIVFRCSRGVAERLPDGWFGVEVPCTGMMTAPWVVAPLLLGAAQVAALPCAATGCDRNLDGASSEAVAFARDVLAALTVAPDRVATDIPPLTHDPLPAVPVDDPFGTRAAGPAVPDESPRGGVHRGPPTHDHVRSPRVHGVRSVRRRVSRGRARRHRRRPSRRLLCPGHGPCRAESLGHAPVRTVRSTHRPDRDDGAARRHLG